MKPKVVSNGSLVTGQTGSNGLDVQKLQFFNLTSDITLANFSSFGVIDNNNSSSSPSGGNNPLLGDNSSNTDFFHPFGFSSFRWTTDFTSVCSFSHWHNIPLFYSFSLV